MAQDTQPYGMSELIHVIHTRALRLRGIAVRCGKLLNITHTAKASHQLVSFETRNGWPLSAISFIKSSFASITFDSKSLSLHQQTTLPPFPALCTRLKDNSSTSSAHCMGVFKGVAGFSFLDRYKVSSFRSCYCETLCFIASHHLWSSLYILFNSQGHQHNAGLV